MDDTQPMTMREATISEAAQLLSLSPATIKRRLQRGDLKGRQISRPQGFLWLVEIEQQNHINTPPTTRSSKGNSDDTSNGHSTPDAWVFNTMEARIASLETQLATKDQQIDQLHHLLAQTALKEASARPWWKIWR